MNRLPWLVALWLLIGGIYWMLAPDQVSIDSPVYALLAITDRWHPHHLLWGWVLYLVDLALGGTLVTTTATIVGCLSTAACAVLIAVILRQRFGWGWEAAACAAIAYSMLPLQLTMAPQWEAYTMAGAFLLGAWWLIDPTGPTLGRRNLSALACFVIATLLHQKLCIAVPLASLWLWLGGRRRFAMWLTGAAGFSCLAIYIAGHQLAAPGTGFVAWITEYRGRFTTMGRISNFWSPGAVGRLSWSVGASWLPGLGTVRTGPAAAIGLVPLLALAALCLITLRRAFPSPAAMSVAWPLAAQWLLFQAIILWWHPVLQTMQWLCLAPGFLLAAHLVRNLARRSNPERNRAVLTLAFMVFLALVLVQRTDSVGVVRNDMKDRMAAIDAETLGNSRIFVLMEPYSQSILTEVALRESGAKWNRLDPKSPPPRRLTGNDWRLVVDESILLNEDPEAVAACLAATLGELWRAKPITRTFEAGRVTDTGQTGFIVEAELDQRQAGWGGGGASVHTTLSDMIRRTTLLDGEARKRWQAGIDP